VRKAWGRYEQTIEILESLGKEPGARVVGQVFGGQKAGRLVVELIPAQARAEEDVASL
jgi:hypothetical protein